VFRMARSGVTRDCYLIAVLMLASVYAGQTGCPRQDSNLRTRLRRAVLYPLSYGGPLLICGEAYSTGWRGFAWAAPGGGGEGNAWSGDGGGVVLRR
jgi:hypothetical protein